MFQSIVDGRLVGRSLLVKDVLPEYWRRYEPLNRVSRRAINVSFTKDE